MASRKRQRNVNAISVHFVKQELCLNDHHPGSGRRTHLAVSQALQGSPPGSVTAPPATPTGRRALRRFGSHCCAPPAAARTPEAPAAAGAERAHTAQIQGRGSGCPAEGPGCLWEQVHSPAQGCAPAQLWCSILVGGLAPAGLRPAPPSPLVWGWTKPVSPCSSARAQFVGQPAHRTPLLG